MPIVPRDTCLQHFPSTLPLLCIYCICREESETFMQVKLHRNTYRRIGHFRDKLDIIDFRLVIKGIVSLLAKTLKFRDKVGGIQTL